MADFKTHLIGASLVAGVTSVLLAVSTEVASDDAIGYYAVGVAGGILPDVDLETSIPIRIARRLVSTIGTLLVLLRFAPEYSLVELVLLAVGVFGVLTAGFDLLGRYTSHRGLVHSLPACASFGFATGVLASYSFGADPLRSWFYAAFMIVGILTHLVLDEMYSVDVMGATLKRSFGSAMSLGDRNNLLGTAALYGIATGLFLLSPPSDDFLSLVGEPQTYTMLLDRVLPDGSWFG